MLLIGSTAAAADDVIITYAPPATGTTETLVANTVKGIQNKTITQLAISEQVPVNNSNIRAVYVASDGPTKLQVMRLNGMGTSLEKTTIKDAAGNENNRIIGLTGNGFFKFFLPVGHNAEVWWNNNSTIGYVTLSNNTNDRLTYVGGNTTPGRAYKFHSTVPEIKSDSANNPAIIETAALDYSTDLQI